VAIREFKMEPGYGYADYLLFVDGRSVGALEAKKEGFTLTGVEPQVQRYSDGLPGELSAPYRPLPFLYLSNGTETRFVNLLDPRPRSRSVFGLPRPETVAEWLEADTLPAWMASRAGSGSVSEVMVEASPRPSTLRARLQRMPAVHILNLWPNKIEALLNLERSLTEDRPRALIQMATGSARPCWRSRRCTASSSSPGRVACCFSSTAPTWASRPL
jgi:type I restriction enzyme R subunit